MLSDIDALNIHLAALAQELGFTAAANLVPARPQGTSAEDGRIEVVVATASDNSARTCSKSVSLADYQDAGIHTFDDFVRAQAVRKVNCT